MLYLQTEGSMTDFIDRATVKVLSGDGGNGIVAWRREKYVDKGGPAGGNGGKGGDVFFVAEENMSTLLDFSFKSVFKAENGVNGQGKNCHGRCGKDLYVKVPVGTIIKDSVTGKVIADLNMAGASVLVAKGGRGGRGNSQFATPQKRAPGFCEPGERGISRTLELELKLIADVGLLGMPNAGKSTLISVISSAKPKIADYPFTTLVPHLGVVQKPDGDTFVVADIPGLTEGASLGVGLGHEFLRHVERCSILVHLVDITAENPVSNYIKINDELKKYDEHLAKVPQILVLNKSDAVTEDVISDYTEKFKEFSEKVFIISAATKNGVTELVNEISFRLEQMVKPEFSTEVFDDPDAYDNDDSAFSIYKTGKNEFVVEGGKVFRLANVTDARSREQISRFINILDAMGVIKALEASGVKNGDNIKIGHIEFDYFK